MSTVSSHFPSTRLTYPIQRRHAVNSPVVSSDVSVLAEGKDAVSTASRTLTVLTAVAATGVNGVDTGSRHTGVEANAALFALNWKLFE